MWDCMPVEVYNLSTTFFITVYTSLFRRRLNASSLTVKAMHALISQSIIGGIHVFARITIP